MVEKVLQYDDGSSTDYSTPVVDSLSEDEREIEPRLRRKLDIRIMPIIVLIYLLNFIDRYTASAKLWTIHVMLTWLGQTIPLPVFRV
jgi:hypothetical protein